MRRAGTELGAWSSAVRNEALVVVVLMVGHQTS